MRGKKGKAIAKDASRVGGRMDSRHWLKPLAPITLLTTGGPGKMCQDQAIVALVKRGHEDLNK